MPQIMLALEGKVDFIKKTNPFGGGDSKKSGKKLTNAQQAKLNAQRTELALLKAEAKAKAKG